MSSKTTNPTNLTGNPGRRSARIGRIPVWGLLAALAIVGAYFASRTGSEIPAANGTGTGPEFAAIEGFVKSEMAAQRIPGLALGIVKDNRVIYLRGFGEADGSGREVTPQTPFIIGSLSKSFTALAIMQLVEAGKVDLDAPVQRYLPWFRVADEDASAAITVRHLLNQTSGLSAKTGRSFQGNGDTSDRALEEAVRKLASASLTAPAGEKYQYSTINYSVLGLIVQSVSGDTYEGYIQSEIFDPLQMRNAFTSQAEAEQQGLASGYNYWFGRPRTADLPQNRGLVPAGYLIASAEDMTHYLIAQINGGRYGDAAVLSPAGLDSLHQPAVKTPSADTSYAMGWFVGPLNEIPAVHHQGETFNFHANAVLIPTSRTGVIVLMNAQNSLDLFTNNRMGTIAEGVTSILEGREPPSPPSNTINFVAYAALFGVVVVQARAVVHSAQGLRSRRVETGRVGRRTRIALSLALSLGWAFFIYILVPKQFGLPLLVVAQGFPDFAYVLFCSAVFAAGWGMVKAIWAYSLPQSRGNVVPGGSETRELPLGPSARAS